MRKDNLRRFHVINGGRNTILGPIVNRRQIIRCTSCKNTEAFRGYVIHSPINVLIEKITNCEDCYDVSEVSYESGPDTVETPTHCAVCGCDKLEFITVDEDKEY